MNQNKPFTHIPPSFDLQNLHPGFSIDCVIFSFHKKKVRVLLNKFDFGKYWQLPGGFMYKNESAEEASKRFLEKRTGITNLYLKQFHLFSDPHRIIQEQNIEQVDALGAVGENRNWLLQRFISLGYYAFVKYNEVKLTSSEHDISQWFALDNLPALFSDHGSIIQTSLENIKTMLTILPVGYELLPEKFTMSELRKIYEFFLDKNIDRRNFQRKVLSLDSIIQLDETGNTSPYNPPILYTFKEGKMDLGESWMF